MNLMIVCIPAIQTKAIALRKVVLKGFFPKI